MTNATSKEPARVRFAPSPTGYLHLGGLRTALFDWLHARHTGGKFILRVEDTDQSRYNPESLEDLIRGLSWLGLDWDEGPDIGGPYEPYVQSERQPIYTEHAEQLVAGGYAYRCYCTQERLDAVRERQRQNNQPVGYDRHCRYLSDEERAQCEAEGRSSVVRLAVPEDGKTVVPDLLRGEVETDNKQLQDAVLLKSDGMPTYHLAVVVDDHLMEITHILRGQEWLSSAPLHRILFDSFGWEMPVMVHLPVILDPSGQGKMSKRKKVVDGKEYLALVHEFIDAGYLPDAMFNFLTNVGWNYDPEQEIFSREDAIARFSLEDVNPAPATLPYEKLDWLNGVYIREMAPEKLTRALAPFLADAFTLPEDQLLTDSRLEILVPVIQERIKRLDEAAEWLDWAFVPAEELHYEDPGLLVGRKLDTAESIAVLERGQEAVRAVEPFDADSIQAALREVAEEMEIKAGSLFGPVRGAISGKKVSPPLFESMEALGREEVVQRLENAIGVLKETLAASA